MPLQFVSKNDVLTRIKSADLDVITEGDDSLLIEPEADAIFEVSSYLSGRYDTDAVFNAEAEARNATIKRIVIDVLIYNLHNRVNPRNIPEKRIQLRDDAIDWLKMVASVRSNVNADFLPKKDFGEKRGNDISWNSRPKRQNDY